MIFACVGGISGHWWYCEAALSWWDNWGFFHSFFECWGCVCSGGMTRSGMDSLINNHHLFLPDLNWSHMLWLEHRHKQANARRQVLIGPLAHSVDITIKLHSTGRDLAARNFMLTGRNKVRNWETEPVQNCVDSWCFASLWWAVWLFERWCAAAAEWAVGVCWTFPELWWVALGSLGKLHWVNWKEKERATESMTAEAVFDKLYNVFFFTSLVLLAIKKWSTTLLEALWVQLIASNAKKQHWPPVSTSLS